MCNRIQATRQQRSGITWGKKNRKKQNNNKQNKKRRKKKAKIIRGRRQEEEDKKKKKKNKKKKEKGKKKGHYSKSGLVKIWGSNYYCIFEKKKLLFSWAFLKKAKRTCFVRALPYIYIYVEGLTEHLLFCLFKTTLAAKHLLIRGNSSRSCEVYLSLSFQHF